MRLCFVYLHQFLQVVCVSQEEFTLIESNQQICDFYKTVIFENKDIVESKFLISANYSFNAIHIADVNIYLYRCVSLLTKFEKGGG